MFEPVLLPAQLPIQGIQAYSGRSVKLTTHFQYRSLECMKLSLYAPYMLLRHCA